MKLQFRKKFDNAWYEALWNFVVSRLTMMLITLLATTRLPSSQPTSLPTPFDCAHQIKQCLLTWDRWDVDHYLYIALNGYQNSAFQGHFPQRTAFFPLWPLLIRIAMFPIGNSWNHANLVSILLSGLCFYFSLVLVYLLVRAEFDTGIAKKAVFLLAFSPYSLFFAVGYTESLFLLLTVGAFFFMKREQWLLAGACGFLAALTRPTGIAVIVPFFILFVQRIDWRRLLSFNQIRLKVELIGALLLVPAGLLTYMVYLKITFGSFLYFSRWEHQEWLRTTTWPWVAIVQSVQALFNPAYPFDINFINLLFVILPLVALGISWRRLPLHYSLFALALTIGALINPVTAPSNTLASVPRYIFVAFPLFIIFAHWTRKPRVELILTILFLAFFTYNVVLFTTTYWVA